jgi:hypothetical protein
VNFSVSAVNFSRPSLRFLAQLSNTTMYACEAKDESYRWL